MMKIKTKKIKPKMLDQLVYFGVAAPILAIPQIHNVWTGNAEGVSLITWSAFLFMACVWLSYAIYHKIKPLIILHCAWIIVNSAVVIGLLFKQ